MYGVAIWFSAKVRVTVTGQSARRDHGNKDSLDFDHFSMLLLCLLSIDCESGL